MARFPASTDVLVVGAGPTGLALAASLRKAGTDVVVIDRTPRRGRESRASVLHTRGIEILETLGAAGGLLDLGAPILATAYYDMGIAMGEVRFDKLDSPAPHALGIGQDHVESALLDRMAELGLKVRRSSTLEALEPTGDTMRATVRSSKGARSVIEARYVVGCDGASSMVRTKCNLDSPELEATDTYVIADVEVSGEIDRSTMHLFSAPDGFCSLSPLPGGEFRLTASMEDAPQLPTVEEMQAVLDSRGSRADTDTLTIESLSRAARYKVRRSVAPVMRSGLMFLAGDAAHTFLPVGGQGMNTGLHDAANLGWKLAAVCSGVAPLGLLSTYDAERQPAAQGTFDRTERLAGALTMSNPIARGLRDVLAVVANVLPPLRSGLQRGLAGLDSVYSAGSYMVGAVSAGPYVSGWGRPGERMVTPPAVLLADGRHHLVVLGDRGTEEAAAACLELSERYVEGPLVHVVGPEPPARGTSTWPDEPGVIRRTDGAPTAVLIRPDGYLGFTGSAEDITDLDVHLDRWFTRT